MTVETYTARCGAARAASTAAPISAVVGTGKLIIDRLELTRPTAYAIGRLAFGPLTVRHWRSRRPKREGKMISSASWRRGVRTRRGRNCRDRVRDPRLQRGVDG